MSGMKELVKRVAAEMQAPAARVRMVRQTAAMLAELEAHCEMAAAVIHDAVAALAERSPEGEPDAALARRLAYLQAACFKVADALAIVQAEAPGCFDFDTATLAELERRLGVPVTEPAG